MMTTYDWQRVWMLAVLLVCYSHVHHSQAHSFKKENFPNPRTNHAACGRDKPSFVCDPEKLISSEEADKIDTAIARIRVLYPCTCVHCGGSEAHAFIAFAVALVPSITGVFKDNDAKRGATKEFAQYLRNKTWNFKSHPQCDNDAVLILAMAQEQVYISLGTVVKKQISAACVNRFIREVDVNNEQKYGESINVLLNEYREAIHDDSICELVEIPARFIVGIGVAAVLVVVSVFVCCVFALKRRKRKYKRTEDLQPIYQLKGEQGEQHKEKDSPRRAFVRKKNQAKQQLEQQQSPTKQQKEQEQPPAQPQLVQDEQRKSPIQQQWVQDEQQDETKRRRKKQLEEVTEVEHFKPGNEERE